MIHRLTIGHLDPDAVRERRVVVTRPLDMGIVTQLLREFVSREVLGRIAEALEVDQPRLRASLAGSQLVGLAMLRYVVKLEPVASASGEQLGAWVGPTLQRYLTAERV